MAREFTGLITGVVDAFRARRHPWVFGQESGHSALADRRNLIAKLGELSLEDAERKLRCAKCGAARASFTPRDKPWSSMR